LLEAYVAVLPTKDLPSAAALVAAGLRPPPVNIPPPLRGVALPRPPPGLPPPTVGALHFCSVYIKLGKCVCVSYSTNEHYCFSS